MKKNKNITPRQIALALLSIIALVIVLPSCAHFHDEPTKSVWAGGLWIVISGYRSSDRCWPSMCHTGPVGQDHPNRLISERQTLTQSTAKRMCPFTKLHSSNTL
jgi:hypothetical protein